MTSDYDHAQFRALMNRLYKVVHDLEEMFPGRHFTPDGNLVGSIGEALVADAYNLYLEPASNKGYDAVTSDGKQVEIKATQGTSVGFRSCPCHAIVIRIMRDGSFEEVYNGPGKTVWDVVSSRPMPSNGQYQISVPKLKSLAVRVPDGQRVERREA